MAEGDIRLHPEHGLNPTIPVCIICGEDKGLIAFLGANYKGEAPRKMIMDIEPCDKCKEKYLNTGVAIFEADPDGRGNPIPTGNFIVIRDEVYEQIFQDKVPGPKIALMSSAEFDQFQKQFMEVESDDSGS